MLPAMVLTGPALEAALAKASAQNGWPFRPLGMTRADILLVDAGAKQIVAGHLPQDGPALLPVDQFNPADVQSGGRVFVLASKKEREMARRLQAGNPELAVHSVCYDVSLHVSGMKQLFQDLDVTMLVASPVCGADYLEALLSANNTAQAVHALDDVTILWAQYASDFSMKRHLLAILSQAKNNRPKLPLVMAIDLDQMKVLRQARLLPPKLIKRISNWLDMGCIFMLRRNKAMQAANILSLGGHSARSLHEAQTASGWQADAGAPAINKVIPIVLELVAQECRFETLLADLSATRVITFEELEANPVAVLSMLVLFLGLGTLKKAKVVNPQSFDLNGAWRQDFEAAFKEHAEAFIGIRKNDVGSYASGMSLG